LDADSTNTGFGISRTNVQQDLFCFKVSAALALEWQLDSSSSDMPERIAKIRQLFENAAMPIVLNLLIISPC